MADQNTCHMTSECNEFAMKLIEKTANHKMETGREMRFVGGDVTPCLKPFSRPKTNADGIGAMSDDELAWFLNECESRGYVDSSITMDGWGKTHSMLEWLQQPAEGD